MPHKRHPDRKVVNFAAGPSALPYDVTVNSFVYCLLNIFFNHFLPFKVLLKAQKDLINYEDTEVSVMGKKFNIA